MITRKTMRSDPYPLFREVIVPWHDSVLSNLLIILFMVFVWLFGAVGIVAAFEHAEYTEYVWVPMLIVFMSTAVIISICLRLVRRYSYRLKREQNKAR